jgi:hypothetical protein
MHFLVVDLSNNVSIDYFETDEHVALQHFAFLVSEEEFDSIYGRIREMGIETWADPARTKPGEINHHDGGRGVYFEDPDGHFLEIITRPLWSRGLAKLFVYESEDRGRDADNDEGRDSSPHGVGFCKFPDGRNAENRANDQGDRYHRERNPADKLRIYDAPGLAFLLSQCDNYVRIGLHSGIITDCKRPKARRRK